jgi:hypothetical protein
MAHISILRVLMIQPKASCLDHMMEIDCKEKLSIVTIDIDGCGSVFRVEVPYGIPMNVSELLRLMNEPSVPTTDELLMVDRFLFGNAVEPPEPWSTALVSSILPQILPEPGLPQQGLPQQGLPPQGLPEPGLPQQGLPQQGLPPQGLPEPGLTEPGLPEPGLCDPGLSEELVFQTTLQELLGLAPYVQLFTDSVILRELAVAMKSRRRSAAGVVKQLGLATLKWRSRARGLLDELRRTTGNTPEMMMSSAWKDTCAPAMCDIVDELRGHYRKGMHHLPMLVMIQEMGREDAELPFAVWNALSAREYEPELPTALEIADTGYAGSGLRTCKDLQYPPAHDGSLLGIMASTVWAVDTHPPCAPDIYVFSTGVVTVICPRVEVRGLNRQVSGGVWGLMNDPHGRACNEQGCRAANVEYLDSNVSRMDEYLGHGCDDARSTVIQCVLTDGQTTVSAGTWLEAHYGSMFQWPETPDVYLNVDQIKKNNL